MRQVLIPIDLDFASLTLPPPSSAIRVLGGQTMGTTWTVKLCAPAGPPLAGPPLAELQREIEDALANIVRQMSPWEPDACLTRLNQAPAGSWHPLPADLFTVLEYALSVARVTRGALDPTIGRLIDRWGFGPPHLRPTAPLPPESQQADWEAVRLDAGNRRALQPGGIRFDLCAVAKGFAVDRLSEIVERHGLPHHLVEIGGECRGAGVKPDGTPWWVAIERAAEMESDVSAEAIVALHGLSIASSGGYRRYRRAGKAWHTHLIDPRGGAPLGDLRTTVTVIASRCMHADAWATALAVLGPDEGLCIAAENGIAALLSSGTGTRRRVRMSPAMAAMLA